MVPVGTLCISQIEKKLLVFGSITGVHWIALCAAPAIFRMLLARNFLLCWLVGYGILLESSVTDLKLLNYGINVCLVVVHRHGYLFHTTLCNEKNIIKSMGCPLQHHLRLSVCQFCFLVLGLQLDT